MGFCDLIARSFADSMGGILRASLSAGDAELAIPIGNVDILCVGLLRRPPKDSGAPTLAFAAHIIGLVVLPIRFLCRMIIELSGFRKT